MSDFNKVFFDTNPLIYYLENDGTFYEKMSKFIVDNADSAFSTSSVTVVEYLTGVFRKGDKEKEQNFRNMISDYKFEVVPVDWNVAEEAARIRDKYRSFKTMDALQLAAAKLTGCDAFVSNDLQLKQYEDVKVLVVDEVEV
ncbi:MAG: PIN domain-containing protein [Oscillospiraceae bacterium]|nr:PIN domain-containing protein [Oscillospiraceae bacterium]